MSFELWPLLHPMSSSVLWKLLYVPISGKCDQEDGGSLYTPVSKLDPSISHSPPQVPCERSLTLSSHDREEHSPFPY